MPEEQPETETKETEKQAKGGKKKILLLLVLLLVIGAGGGGGFYFWRVRASAKEEASSHKKKADAEGEAGGEDEQAEVTAVIEFQPFIVNLADKTEPRYLRMSISLGVAEHEGEEKTDPLFTTKVRNAILGIVTTKTSDEVLTVEGKATLRKEMLEAAKHAVSKPKVHAIYITDFIIQM